MVHMEPRLDEIMISDPISGTDIPNTFQTIESGNGRFSTIRLTDANSDSIWSIAKWDRGVLGTTKRFWWAGEVDKDHINGIDIGPVSAEQFMSQLMISYPDYFEWFLFHPEWFQ